MGYFVTLIEIHGTVLRAVSPVGYVLTLSEVHNTIPNTGSIKITGTIHSVISDYSQTQSCAHRCSLFCVSDNTIQYYHFHNHWNNIWVLFLWKLCISRWRVVDGALEGKKLTKDQGKTSAWMEDIKMVLPYIGWQCVLNSYDSGQGEVARSYNHA